MDENCDKQAWMNSAKPVAVSTPSDREIVITRVFNAPRRLVFDSISTPDLVRQWLLGPPGWTMPVCEIDTRIGGAYRFLWRGPDGKQMGSSGVTREFLPPARFVTTERFDDAWYAGEALVTYDLIEKDGLTTLTLTILYESRETRDLVLKTRMDKGIAFSYDRLEEILESLASSGQGKGKGTTAT
jgi:uncharacterized protein YndB with AHSA1/START domain